MTPEVCPGANDSMPVPVRPAGAGVVGSVGLVWQGVNQVLRARYPGWVASFCAYALVGALVGIVAWVLTNPVPVHRREGWR